MQQWKLVIGRWRFFIVRLFVDVGQSTVVTAEIVLPSNIDTAHGHNTATGGESAFYRIFLYFSKSRGWTPGWIGGERRCQ